MIANQPTSLDTAMTLLFQVVAHSRGASEFLCWYDHGTSPPPVQFRGGHFTAGSGLGDWTEEEPSESAERSARSCETRYHAAAAK